MQNEVHYDTCYMHFIYNLQAINIFCSTVYSFKRKEREHNIKSRLLHLNYVGSYVGRENTGMISLTTSFAKKRHALNTGSMKFI
jgi:hypothetical protein